MKKVTVKQNEENQVPIEILAESIKAISDSTKKLREGRLNDKAIVLLIHDICKLPKSEIKSVLDSMEVLSSVYLNKKKS